MTDARFTYHTGLIPLDERDAAILAERQAARDVLSDLLTGDIVRYPDGTTRRISHVWQWGGGRPESVQTSDGGSWHLHKGGGSSFSGGLHGGRPPHLYTDSGETGTAVFWFFHHDLPGAGRGVDCEVTVRIWDCAEPPN